MQKSDAISKADYWIEMIIKNQPQFVIPNLVNAPEAGTTLAQELLALRKKLIEGFQTQE